MSSELGPVKSPAERIRERLRSMIQGETPDNPQAGLRDLLTDIRHAAAELGLDFDAAVVGSEELFIEEDELRCPRCDDPMDKDCQGRSRCPSCDGPCPDCFDGGGPV